MDKRRKHIPANSKSLPKGIQFFPEKKKFGIDIHADGRRIRKGNLPNRATAERVLAKLRTEIAEGKYLDKKKIKNPLFSAVVKEYEKWAQSRKKSYENTEKYQLKELMREFGEKKLADLTPTVIEKFLTKLMEREGRTPATCNRYRSLLSRVFHKAIDWEFFEDRNPITKVSKMREPSGRERVLRGNERECLLAAAEEPLKSFILAALCTGCRKDELLQLQWAEVDLDSDIIKILGENAKTGKSREIPIHPELKEILINLPSRFQGQFVFINPNTLKPLRQPKGGSIYIRRAWKQATERAGIKDLQFHDLRHDFCTNAMRSGIHPKIVQEWMGHSKSIMTDRYTNFGFEETRAAMAKLSSSNDDATSTKTSIANLG